MEQFSQLPAPLVCVQRLPRKFGFNFVAFGMSQHRKQKQETTNSP